MIGFLQAVSVLFGAIQFSSDCANFVEKELSLEGNTTLIHEFGTIRTGRAKIQGFEEENLPSHFYLDKGVHVSLEQGCFLKSDVAFFDYPSRTITFQGKEGVLYKDNVHSFTVKAQKTVGYIPHLSSKSFHIFDIETFHFYDQIELTMKDEYQIIGGSAVYKKSYPTDLLGIFDLYPNFPKKYCTLLHQKDWVKARSVHWNLGKDTFTLDFAHGSFSQNQNSIDFRCKSLIWNQKDQLVTFQDSPHFTSPNLYELTAEEVVYNLLEKKLFAKGSVDCTFLQTRDHFSMLGTLTVDEERKEITAAPSEGFVLWENQHLSLKADSLKANYDTESVQRVDFSNNVQMILSENGSLLGYGISDSITYDLAQNLFVLRGKERVLFWKKDGGISMSAKEIHINKQREIRGIGDVHFAFNEQEHKQFLEVFSEYLDVLSDLNFDGLYGK